jgi:Ca2+-binding EF-hand superfamily protein
MKVSHHPWLTLFVIGSVMAQEPPAGPAPGGNGEDDGERRRFPTGPSEPAASDGGPRGPRGGGKERQGLREMMETWKKADTDGDGFITLAEFSAMERIAQLPEEKRAEIFKRFDKNGDGKIGPDELPRPQGGMPSLFQVDANKDGRIVFEEFQNLSFVKRLPLERQRALFERMDNDKDGAITAKDRPQGGPPRDGKWDGKRDGKGGGRGPGFPELIQSLDRNGDGALDFEEFRQAPFLRGKSEDEQEDRFEEMDRNGDLKIDAADFPPPGDRKPRPAGPDSDP